MRHFTVCLLLLGLLLQSCSKGRDKVEILVQEDSVSGKISIQVLLPHADLNGLKGRGASGFALFLLDGDKPLKSPVACDYLFHADSLQVNPTFLPGRNLNFEFQLFRQNDTLRKRFSTANILQTSVASVENIFPLSDSIPENILMFHVLFSEPMIQDRKAYEQVSLLDENGRKKSKVWREKSHWTQDGRHLVLMVHPGRIKRGIAFKEEEGALLEPGKKYTLLISKDLKNLQANELQQEYKRTFVVSKADRQIPACQFKPEQVLKIHSSQTLSISFSEPMDYGSMLIGIRVADANGEQVKGKVRCVNDRLFMFEPDAPWMANSYTLELNDYVADLANNHLHRRFEESSLQDITHRPLQQYRFAVQ